jgi:hypothetical protein
MHEMTDDLQFLAVATARGRKLNVLAGHIGFVMTVPIASPIQQ